MGRTRKMAPSTERQHGQRKENNPDRRKKTTWTVERRQLGQREKTTWTEERRQLGQREEDNMDRGKKATWTEERRQLGQREEGN